MNKFQQQFNEAVLLKQKKFAILIDPDKATEQHLDKIIRLSNESVIDYFFVGGSILVNGALEKTIDYLKSKTKIPVIIFPGAQTQVYNKADAILLLSLISGRNPELLIGNHVQAAANLKNSKLEIMPTGYVLIDGGIETSVTYISNTRPIPANKTEIAVMTCIAGEMLGLKNIYLEAGSGAKFPVSETMIKEVRAQVNTPIIVDGGITSPEIAFKIAQAGADILVVGNAIEKESNLLIGISEAIKSVERSNNLIK